MEAIALEQEALARRAASSAEALKHAIEAAEAYMRAAKQASGPAEKARLKLQCEQAIAFAERLKKTPPAGAAVPTPASGSGPGPVPVVIRHGSTPPVTATSSPGLLASPAAPAPAPGPPSQSRRLPANEEAILLRSSRLHDNLFPVWKSEPSRDAFALSSSDGRLYCDPAIFPLSLRQQDIFAGWKRPSEMFSDINGDNKPPPTLEPVRRTATGCESDLVQDITPDCSVVASLCAAMKHFCAFNGKMLSSLMYPYPFDPATTTPVMSDNGKYMFRMHFNGCCRQVTIDDRLPSSKTERTLFVVDRKNPQLIWPALMEKAYLKVRGGYDFPGSNSGTDLWVLTGWIPEQIFLHTDDVELDQCWNRIKRAYDYGDVVVTLGTGKLGPEEEETLGLAGEHDYAVMDLRVESSGNGDGSSRRMLVKNPWCDGLVWKGVGSSAVVHDSAVVATSYKQSDYQGDTARKIGEMSLADSMSSPSSSEGMTGTFWIAFEDVVQNFESLYLNWNPALFTHRQDHHFVWDMPNKAMANSFAPNPQYSVCAPEGGSVWALLSRHFQDEELEIARRRSSSSSASLPPASSTTTTTSSSSSSSSGFSSSLGFMSLYVFSGTSGGTRIQLPDRPRPLHRGHFVDSPQTLVRFEARRGERYTLAVAQSGLPLPRYCFTLAFFSRCPLDVNKAAPPHPHREVLTGAWTRRSAGGNSAEPTYLSNPQYALRVESPTPLSLLLCADNPDVPVHVALLFSDNNGGGKAGGSSAAAAAVTTHVVLTTTTARDIVASSGEYRRGGALCTVSRESPTATGAGGSPVLRPGLYTVVLSTFEPGQLAGYTLEVGSSSPSPVLVTSAPRTGAAAGRLRTALAPVPATTGPVHAVVGGAGAHATHATTPPRGGSRDASSGAAGAPARHHRRRHRAPLIVSRLTRVSVSVAPRFGGLDAVCVALEAGAASGARRRVLVVSHGDDGEFGDAARGARTAEVDVDPELARREGGLWVVVEQAGAAAAAGAGSRSGAGSGAGPAVSSPAGGSGGGRTMVEVLSDNPVRVGAWEFVED